MKTVTLNVKNTNDYQLILLLAKRLGMELSEKHEKILKKPGAEMANALTKLASLGGINSIQDPVSWQKRIRKDRKLL